MGERNESGEYTRQYTNREILEAFETAPIPVLTVPEVATAVGCSRVTAHNRLEALVEDGRLYRKEAGARAVVYVRLEDEGGRPSGYGEWMSSLWTDGCR